MQSQELIRKTRKSLQFNRHIPSSNLEVIAGLTANGVGVGILPERVAQLHKNLKPVSSHWFTDELYLAYRADQDQTAGFKFIIERIIAHIA